jgi:hypothetical protein
MFLSTKIRTYWQRIITTNHRFDKKHGCTDRIVYSLFFSDTIDVQTF